ncbi:MAG: CPBP family intramembrane glutamic endopeptidase [Alistipes sp.]
MNEKPSEREGSDDQYQTSQSTAQQSDAELKSQASASTEKPKKRSSFPTLGDLLAIVGLVLVSTLISQLGTYLLGCQFPTMKNGEMVYPPSAVWGHTVAVSYFLLMCVLITLTLLYRALRGGHGRLVRFSARGFNPILILWGVVLLIATNVVFEPLVNFFQFMPMPDMGTGGWVVLMTVVAAPLFEELLCRGIVLESIRTKYGVVAAWLLSSIFFAILHVHPAMVVNAFIIGLLFGYIYIRSSSLFPTIFLHAFNNALALALMWTHWSGERFAGKPLSSLRLSEIIGNQGVYVVVYLLALMIFVASGYMVYRTLRQIKQDEKKQQEA